MVPLPFEVLHLKRNGWRTDDCHHRRVDAETLLLMSRLPGGNNRYHPETATLP